MGTIVFSYNIMGRDASLIAVGNDIPTAPASNLFLPHPGYFWRSSGLTTMYVVLQLGNAPGATQPRWDLLSLLYTNATTTDTWRIRAAATQAALTTSPTYDSTALLLYQGTVATVTPWRDSVIRPAILHLSAVRTEAWIRIDIVSTAPEGYFQAGNLIIDEAIISANHSSRNFQLPLEHGSPNIPARINLDYLSEADAMKLDTAAKDNRGEGLFAAYDPGETFYVHNNIIWGRERPGSGVRLHAKTRWTRQYIIDSFA